MGLFDTIVGGASSPVFLSYQRSNNVDYSPLLKYGDYRSKVAQSTLGKKPDISPTEIKKGISDTDVAHALSIQNQGLKEVSNVFQKYGNNYNYAITTDEYKKAISKVNIPVSDIIRMEEEKDKWDRFDKDVQSKQASNLVYTGERGLVGAYDALNTKTGKYYTTGDALKARQTDPNYAYQVNDNLPMNSTLTSGKDAEESLDKLFSTAKVSKVGGSWQSVTGKQWDNTAAILLNTMHSSGGDNAESLKAAAQYFATHLSEDAKVGIFNEFKDSNTFYSKFGDKAKNGTLKKEEVAQFFEEEYIPDYITKRAASYFQQDKDLTIGTNILERDLAGRYEEKEEKKNFGVAKGVLGGSPTFYNTRSNINLGFGTKKDDDGEYKNVFAINAPSGTNNIEWVSKLKDAYIDKDGIGAPAGSIGKNALGPNGQMINLNVLQEQGFRIGNISDNIMYLPKPKLDANGNYLDYDEKDFVKNDKGEYVPKDPNNSGAYMKVTFKADPDATPSDFPIYVKGGDGKYRKEDANQSSWNIIGMGGLYGSPYDNYNREGNEQIIREVDGMVEYDLWVEVSDANLIDAGKMNNPNWQAEQENLKAIEKKKKESSYYYDQKIE